ncbi:MAG: class I SAM-dependent methyltransferase [Thermoguttaceae bacterium]
MWHDTRRFVRCAKEAFDFPPPVHEYGLAAAGQPLVAPRSETAPRPRDLGESPDKAPHLQPLEELAELPHDDGSVGTVACLNIFQHVTDPGTVAREMIRVLAPGGVFLVCSCTGGQGVDNSDLLWRPAPHAFQRLLAPLEATLIGWQGREGNPHSIYAIGCKAPVTPLFLAGTNQFLKTFRQSLASRQRATPWTEKARQWISQICGRPTTGRGRADYYHFQFFMHAQVDAQFQHDLLANCLQIDKIGGRLDLSE